MRVEAQFLPKKEGSVSKWGENLEDMVRGHVTPNHSHRTAEGSVCSAEPQEQAHSGTPINSE